MNDNASFYEVFAPYYEAYYRDVDAAAAVRQWSERMKMLGTLPLKADQLQNGNELLDIGCGPGWHLREWSRAGFIVSGLDVSPSMLYLARRNWQQCYLHPAGVPRLLCADIRDSSSVAILTGAFSVAVAHFNFLNLFCSAELAAVFSSISSILTETGIFATDLTLRSKTDGGSSDIHEVFPRKVHWSLPGIKRTERYWFHSLDEIETIAGSCGLLLSDGVAWRPSSRPHFIDFCKSDTTKAWIALRKIVCARQV